jgi:hypothetical protein
LYLDFSRALSVGKAVESSRISTKNCFIHPP